MAKTKFEELYEKYTKDIDPDYTVDRKIRAKLKEIIICQEECNPAECEFTYQIIDKFCELIELIEDRNSDSYHALLYKYGELDETPEPSTRFINPSPETSTTRYMGLVPVENAPAKNITRYPSADALLTDFYNRFSQRRSESTVKDYAARIKTFANSNQYLKEMLRTGELGIRETNMDLVLFTYENIELILARFNTKDEHGVAIKQRNNIRSALRMLNDFKKERES